MTDRAVQRVMAIIDDATRPEHMEAEEALEFLEDLESEIDDRINALKAMIAIEELGIYSK